MKATRILSALVLASLAATLPAQVQAMGGSSQRMSSTVFFFNQDFSSPGFLFLQYGQPSWKDEYDLQVEKAKGNAARLGKDYWASFETSCALTLGGAKVAAGQYYLGIACSEKGEWTLVLFDAEKCRKNQLTPFMTADMVKQGTAVAVSAPMTYTKSEKSVEKLSLELAADKKETGKGSLTLAWGKHQLSAPMVCEIAKEPKKADKKDG